MLITPLPTGVQWPGQKVRAPTTGAKHLFSRRKLSRLGAEWPFVSSSLPFLPHPLTGAALPAGVTDLEDPPTCLYLTGSLPPGPRVAIVGTRRPTEGAYRFARELASSLARAGVAVVSGGALGIDTAAHEGALDAGAGTLVVAPSSYSRPYPEQNRELFSRVVEQGGGYLTPFDEPTVARRHVFFSRNALLVSVCVAVVLVQAPYRSGARNATLWARRLQRPYWVVPHAPWCSSGASSAAELRLGGKPLASAADLLSWLNEHHYTTIPLATQRVVVASASPDGPGGSPPTKTPIAAKLTGSDPDQTRRGDPRLPREICQLLGLLAAGPRHPDELCAELDWAPAQFHVTVLHATLMGEVRRTEAGLLVACGG